MSRTYVSAELRRQVQQRARERCEYCLLPEVVSFLSFEVDHIVAEKHGGATLPENLAWACALCNNRKGTDLSSIDPETGRGEFLFHPRSDRWGDHFQLENGMLVPRTGKARATIRLLGLNDPEAVEIRRLLASIGQLIVP